MKNIHCVALARVRVRETSGDSRYFTNSPREGRLTPPATTAFYEPTHIVAAVMGPCTAHAWQCRTVLSGHRIACIPYPSCRPTRRGLLDLELVNLLRDPLSKALGLVNVPLVLFYAVELRFDVSIRSQL